MVMFNTITNRHKKNLSTELSFLAERIEIDGLKPEYDVRLATYHIDALNFEKGIEKLKINTINFPENIGFKNAFDHGKFLHVIYNLAHDYNYLPSNKKLRNIADLLITSEKSNLYPRLEYDLEEKIYSDLIKSKELMEPKSIIRLTMSLHFTNPNFISKINSVLKVSDFDLKTETDIKKFNEIVEFFWGRQSFLELLKFHIIPDLRIEKFLSNIRTTYLQNHNKIIINSQHLKFLDALCSQSFMNEFIFPVSNEEKRLLEALERDLFSSNASDETKIPIKLKILACYKELSESKYQTFIKDCPELSFIYNTHLKQKLIEQKLKEKIPSFLKLNDKISESVQLQYESNPYPRWNSIHVPQQKEKIEDWLYSFSEKFENLKDINIKYPKILVAGAGTGQQSISTALIISGSSVDALDLSKASLSYALRKANELNVKNIKFMQADLFEIDFLGENYDLIQCSGVLHHTSDPLAGLINLKSKLKSHGVMQIGLYSRFARFHLNKIRNEIANQAIGNSKQEMLAFRERLIKSKSFKKEAKVVTQWGDFFTTSMFRDLCFHAHEVQYDCHDLKRLIDAAGLEFAGMMLPLKKRKEYQRITGKSAQSADLDDWYDFELNNTSFFAEMYNFFVRPKSKEKLN